MVVIMKVDIIFILHDANTITNLTPVIVTKKDRPKRKNVRRRGGIDESILSVVRRGGGMRASFRYF